MDAAAFVTTYFEAAEKGDWKTFGSSLSEDFIFRSAPVTQTRNELVSSTKALWAAFPDLKFHFRAISVQGNVVKGTYQITGTHTGMLIPPVPGAFVTVAPTGKKILLPEAGIELTLEDGKIVAQNNEPKPESGWPGILDQLGVRNPYS